MVSMNLPAASDLRSGNTAATTGKREPATGDCPPPVLTRVRRTLAMAVVLGCMTAFPAAAEGMDRIVASIKPVHSLVSAVMAGVGEPYLMIQGAASPHSFSLRPSDAVKLKNAQIIFLVDSSLEVPLVKPVQTLAEDARVVMLSEAKGLVLKKIRVGGTFEAHAHDRHEEGAHADESDDAHRDDHHDTEAHHEHHEHEGHHAGHEAGHDMDHPATESPYDMHVWLDPENAGAMVRKIAAVLSETDPDNAAIYAANARTLLHRLDELSARITADLAPVRNRSFIVLHDAYHYFEARFGLSAAGSITVGGEHTTSAQRVRKLRNRVQELEAVCVFSEPQFDNRIVEVVTENTPSRIGVLDPLGATIEAGPEAYFTLLQDLAASFRECLAFVDH